MSHTVAPNSLPVFDGSNYTLWKIRMRAYLKFIDVWHIVESGWSIPDKTTAEWTTVENRASSANDKALHSIFTAVTMEEFSRISRCVIAKEAWETLEITHEGTEVVRASKLQMLVSKFEEIWMQEDETFDEFYSKLSSIRNNTINLGKKMSDAKIIKKILRSLPTRFLPQIAATNQINDLNTMRAKELVESIQTFELLLPKPKNLKNIALKTKTAVKEKSGDSTDEDSGDEEEIAMIVRKFRKFFKPKNGNFKGRVSKNPVNHRYDGRDNIQDRNTAYQKEKVPSGRKCHERGGIGHIQANCGNLRNSKGKAFNVTQSDESEDDDSEDDEEVNVNYLAFTASYTNEYDNSSEQIGVENESDDEQDLQTAYNQMFQEFNKLGQQNKKNLKRLKEVETENEKLVEKIKSLEKELNESRSHLNKFSSVKLNKMLSDQKPSHDRAELGFEKHVSEKSNGSSTSKIMFVKPKMKEVESELKLLPKEASLVRHRTLKSNFKNSHKRVSDSKFIPTCHHCGIIGHTRPNCFQIRARLPWSTQNVPRRDEPRIEKQLQVLTAQVKLISEKLASLSTGSDLTKAVPMTENANTQQVWVKKKDNLSFVVHTALSVLNSCLWYLDSACSRHMIGDKTLFKELKEGRSGNITYGDGSKSKVMGQGTVDIPGVPTPQEVLYVEGLKVNLLSISQLCDNDLVVQFSKEECSIFDAQGKWLMGGDRTSDNCYGISPTMQTKCHKTSVDIRELWHQRLGHLNYHDLIKIAKKEVVSDLPKINYLEKGKCGPCQLGKQTRNPHKKTSGANQNLGTSPYGSYVANKNCQFGREEIYSCGAR
jgi:hypothetical protein